MNDPTADSMTLPIYVEASPLLTKHLTGVGRYVARLIEALLKYVPLRLVNTIQGEHARNMKLSNALRCGQEIALSSSDVPPADDDVRAWARRLFHRPLSRHNPRLAQRCPMLYTLSRPQERHFRKELCLVYDFTPLLLPQFHVAETCEHFREFSARKATSCDKLVAISRSTQADASWLCAVPPEDVEVGYPGPTLCVRNHAHPEPVERTKDLILVVSTLEPRKNGAFLLDWFLQTGVLRSGTELWWVGPTGWLCNLLRWERKRGVYDRTIRFPGVVSDRRLCELYRKAAFTIYPSLYEGFGLPVLDSLRHGTPVLSSFNSSLQEFAGPGVFYFDPCDPVSLDAACQKLLRSGPISFVRNDLDDRFSWDALARKVIALSA